MKRLVLSVAGGAAGYLAVLLIAGWLVPGCVAERMKRRLAASLDAEVEIGDVDLDLLGGNIIVRDLHIVRDRGAVDITIDRADATIASFGRVIYDRDLGAVAVRGAEVTLTGAGAVGLRGGERAAEPVSMQSLRLTEVTIVVTPTALMPRLGRVEVQLERAVTGPLELRNAMSWVHALEELRAVVDVGGASGAVDYGAGELSVGAGLFGSRPITVPFRLPRPEPEALELAQLKSVAAALARALGPAAARRWLGRELLERLLD